MRYKHPLAFAEAGLLNASRGAASISPSLYPFPNAVKSFAVAVKRSTMNLPEKNFPDQGFPDTTNAESVTPRVDERPERPSAVPGEGHEEAGVVRASERVLPAAAERNGSHKGADELALHRKAIKQSTTVKASIVPPAAKGLPAGALPAHGTEGPAKGAAPVATSASSRTVVLPRDLRPLSSHESRRLLSKRSQQLQEFVVPLEEQLRKLARLRTRARRMGVSGVVKVAELVLSTIRKLAHQETGMYVLEPNVPLLLNALFAGPVEAAIVGGLVRRAQVVMAAVDQLSGVAREPLHASGLDRSVQEYDLARELDELAMLLKWYVRRKVSLAGIEVDSLRRAETSDGPTLVINNEEDALFGVEVLHDHEVFGAKGCFVACGVKLIGHDSQALWLRVSALWNGEPVQVRPDWSSWTDPAGGEAGEGVTGERGPFCSLVPIRPQAQRLVIDEIRAFIPYAALDIPSGRCDVDLCVTVVDSDGKEVLSAARRESLCVPRRELPAQTVPAPHSVGMWPHDVVSGDKISELRLASGYKVVAGWERHTVSVQFDLALFMHAGESVLLECRFIDERGELVELSSLGIPYVATELNVPVESVSSYRYRRILHPRAAWAHYRSLCIDIPVEFLLLTPGLHQLTCEVVIVSSDDRVLCGDMGLVAVQVAGASVAAAGAASGALERAAEGGAVESGGAAARPATAARGAGGVGLNQAGWGHCIELESLEIDPAWQLGDEECVRVQATFCPKDAARQIAELAAGRAGELFAPYRAEVLLEREDGHVLLQAFSDALGMGFKPVTRAVCVEGHSGFAEHSVVANFRKDEILGWSFGPDNQRGVTKLRLFARVRALSLRGEVLIDERKEFFVKPISDGGRQVLEIGSPMPRIVDVVAHTYVQTPRLSCRALVNIPAGRFLEQGVTLRCAIVHLDGRSEVIFTRALAAPRAASWVRQQIGLTQVACECEHTIGAGLSEGLRVEVALLNSDQEVLDLRVQPVRVGGVLREVESVTHESFQSAPRAARVELGESAGGRSEAGPAGQRNRGLLWWLRPSDA